MWRLLLRGTGSRARGLSGCSTEAYLLRDTWDLPRPGIEPVSPALGGGFLTTEPLEKPKSQSLEAWSQHPQCHPFSHVLLDKVIKEDNVERGEKQVQSLGGWSCSHIAKAMLKGSLGCGHGYRRHTTKQHGQEAHWIGFAPK